MDLTLGEWIKKYGPLKLVGYYRDVMTFRPFLKFKDRDGRIWHIGIRSGMDQRGFRHLWLDGNCIDKDVKDRLVDHFVW